MAHTGTAEDLAAAVRLTGLSAHYFDVHDDCGVDCPASPAWWAAEQASKTENQAVKEIDALIKKLHEVRERENSNGVPGAGGVEGAALRLTRVLSSSGNRYYSVVERNDTVHGGTYWFCDCQGWATSRGRGKDCRHVAITRVRAEIGEL